MNILIDNKGISLIALVVTIIVILILVGVSIESLSNSIIERAELASEKITEASEKEEIDLENSDLQISKYSNGENTVKDIIKVGDYIEYPVEYNDAYTNTYYTATDGWRVIDDGVMNGTSGNVRIISSHIPVKFMYDPIKYNNKVNNVIDELINKFEEQDFDHGFTANTISGSYFKVNNLAKSVTTLTLNDLNNAHNAMYSTQRESDSVVQINANDTLLAINQMAVVYWIATGNGLGMYSMSQYGIFADSDIKFGIRPVVVLNDNLTYTKENDIWKIN